MDGDKFLSRRKFWKWKREEKARPFFPEMATKKKTKWQKKGGKRKDINRQKKMTEKK